MRRLILSIGLALCCVLTMTAVAHAHDWPMSRYDAERSASTPEELSDKLQLIWTRQLPELRPAWPDQPKLKFDTGYDPILVGSRLILASSFDDSVTAWSTQTGVELWRFSAMGPVRFAPLVWDGKVYFVSDDGYLYCLNIDDGSLLWKFRGGPENRLILGNERLISMWPARGAPVIAEGKIYFTAGIWPFMGIFIHALNATNGKQVWTNSGDGSRYMKQPHFSDAFAGVAPQGPLAVSGDKLLIPGGRSVPACYDRHTGELLYYQLAENGKKGGGAFVSANDKFLFNGGAVFDLETEKYLGVCGEHTAFAGGRLYDFFDRELRVSDLKGADSKTTETVDRKGVKTKSTKWTLPTLAKIDAQRTTCLIKAGSTLFVGSDKSVAAYALSSKSDSSIKLKYELPIDGSPHAIVAANKQLFVTTLDGKIYCFGSTSKPTPTVNHTLQKSPPRKPDEQALAQAAELLQVTGARDGYALVYGGGNLAKLLALLQQSSLRLMVFEADTEKAAQLRLALCESGIGADRLAILPTNPLEVELPSYLASLILVDDAPASDAQLMALLKKTYASLRPYGGNAVWNTSSKQLGEVTEKLSSTELHGAEWKQHGEATILTRVGALPGSGNWTHEHADAANSRVSADQLVKAPLGLLWFGGTSNEGILPRHGHGPQPQVIDGRLFIEGVNMLRAIDIYTGRLLWETPIPGIGNLYDNTAHQPGANAIGTNYIATPDGIYVVHEQRCVKLDPASGKQLAEFLSPAVTKNAAAPRWGYVNISGDYLIGGADPLYDPTLIKAKPSSSSSGDDPDPVSSTVNAVKDLVDSKTKTTIKEENDNYSASKNIVVMNRQTGKVLWSIAAHNGFRHNSICIGGGRLYCIDRLSGAQLSRFKRRGETPTTPARLLVLDLSTGKELWSSNREIFGTWLSYSIEHDVLVEAGRTARDTLSDEAKGMRAYAAKTGKELWYHKSYLGPAMLHHKTVLMTGNACDLLTGKPKLRAHPFNDEPLEWVWSRNYGCNTPMASEHLLTFRSGAAGYFDLLNDGGTGNFGGFRSSCTNNLVVAGGVLTAPDYTRSCTCSYQNQTSVALVHMPEAEIWTSFGSQTPKLPIKRLGVNLGAPGDRKADDGTLWIEYPSVGGSSPAVAIEMVPAKPKWFRGHSAEIEGGGLNWVTASGAVGLKQLNIKLLTNGSNERRYTVRLHFAEPEDVAPGERVFDIKLQSKPVLVAFDVRESSGSRNRTIVKEFRDITVTEELQVELTPDPKCKYPDAIISGVEVQAQEG